MATELKKETIKQGNGTDKPQNGDTVTMEYTGWLFDSSADKNRGKQSVSLSMSLTALLTCIQVR